MTDPERLVRAAFAEGAERAPSADGLADAVGGRLRARRARRMAVASVAVVVIAGIGGVAALMTEQESATSSAGMAAPTSSTVVGWWQPVAIKGFPGDPRDTSRPRAPIVELRSDGTWSASDGCNGSRGSYRADPSGGFAAESTGATTLIGCANVPNTEALTAAARYERRGAELVLLAPDGSELARYVSTSG